MAKVVSVERIYDDPLIIERIAAKQLTPLEIDLATVGLKIVQTMTREEFAAIYPTTTKP